MTLPSRLGTLAVLGILSSGSGRAMAEHDHAGDADVGGEAAFTASLTLAVAAYDTMLYGGDYQGISPAARWSSARLAVSASMPYYQVTKNGKTLHGPGDGMVHGVIALVRTTTSQAGVALAVTAPTGDRQEGLGMGHVMVMPAAWGSHVRGDVTVGGSVGYGQALGNGHDHGHGAGPIVDPMNNSEVTWSASADLDLARELRAGARASGAVPTADGTTRVVGGLRVAWTAGPVVTAATVQVGIAGDPFTLRGVVETSFRF